MFRHRRRTFLKRAAASGIVAAFTDQYGRSWVLLDNGEMWRWESGGWTLQGGEYQPLPRPPSQIKFIFRYSNFIDTDNNMWQYIGEEGWTNHGPPPGLTATQPTTWGGIKARFGE